VTAVSGFGFAYYFFRIGAAIDDPIRAAEQLSLKKVTELPLLRSKRAMVARSQRVVLNSEDATAESAPTFGSCGNAEVSVG
jgi:hypothetical protein